jgi:uncharacterized membrane protein YhiD involved in acid resistance
MPLHLSFTDLAVRLLCTLIAGAIIGYNRGEHGEAAVLGPPCWHASPPRS